MMIHFAFYTVSEMAAWLLSEIPFCDYGAFNRKFKNSFQLDPVNKWSRRRMTERQTHL